MAKSKDVDVVAVLARYPQCECQNDCHFLGGGHECAKKHTSGLQVQIIKE